MGSHLWYLAYIVRPVKTEINFTTTKPTARSHIDLRKNARVKHSIILHVRKSQNVTFLHRQGYSENDIQVIPSP